jgi:transposase-like protein
MWYAFSVQALFPPCLKVKDGSKGTRYACIIFSNTLLWEAALYTTFAMASPEAIRSLCEDEEHLLTFYAFPPVMHRYIRSTNAIESFFSNVRQRTDQIDAFTTETSCLTVVWAVMQDIHLPKIPVG